MIPRLASFPGYSLGETRPLMQPEGRGTSGLMLMGEALGVHEETDRLPFRPYAEAGSVLERALWRAGVSREILTLTNVVWYRPPDNFLDGAPYEMEAIRACKPFNDALVEKVRPRCILALGGTAFRELTGFMGAKEGVLLCRGFVIPGLAYPGIPVVGTYHPSFLRRGSKEKQKETPRSKTEAAGGGTQGMALLGVLIRDIKLALTIATKGAPKFEHGKYVLGATIEDWLEFERDCRDHPELPISYDWETPTSTLVLSEEEIEAGAPTRDIIQGQMSLRPGEAIVSKFFPEVLEVWRRILALPNPKLDWNGRTFDRPLARAYGVEFGGVLHDLMDFWHHAQPDLPRGLQYATSFFCPEVGPWKHQINTDALWYGALDVDMPQRIYAALRQTLGTFQEPHSRVTLLRGYEEQVVSLAPVLDRMSARGIPVNEEKRVELDADFSRSLGKEAYQEFCKRHGREEPTPADLEAVNGTVDQMQVLAPEGIRGVEPKEGIKRASKIPQVCLEASGQVRLDGTTAEPSSRAVAPNGQIYVARRFWDPKAKANVDRWAKLQAFTPSPKQLLAYFRYKGYRVPRNIKTDRETTDELSLRRLIKEHPEDKLMPLVLDHREIEKARGTYVEGWKPDRAGRVHPTFGYGPATGQLSSTNPNGQNFPKHSELARSMRRMIEARPGHHLVSFDWKSFHVLTTGFEAQDPTYMRIARLDMHSFFALVGLLRLEEPEKVLELPDGELAAKLAWYRKQPKVYREYICQAHPAGMTFNEIRDEKAKRTILGVGFGQSASGMYKRNRESFGGLRDAENCLAMLNRVFPLPELWRGSVRLEADRNAELRTRYGYVRRFWDVFSRKIVASNFQPRRGQLVLEDNHGRRWLLGPGDDHEACVAYRPANDAFGIKREVMVGLGRDVLDEHYKLINEIHDDLLFECPDEKLDEMIPEVKGRMEAPSAYLVDPVVAPKGLWCEVSVEIGRNWDKKDSQNPEGMEKIKV